MSYSNRAYIHSYCSLSIHYYNNFYFRSFFSLSSPFAQPTPSSSASSSEAHTPTDKIKNQPQNQQQNHPETPQNQTHPHMDTLTETERVDRRLWQIGVLGSECLDQRSSHHAWIRDRESGSAQTCLTSKVIAIKEQVLISRAVLMSYLIAKWRISVLQGHLIMQTWISKEIN